jgi:hypothetical protein
LKLLSCLWSNAELLKFIHDEPLVWMRTPCAVSGAPCTPTMERSPCLDEPMAWRHLRRPPERSAFLQVAVGQGLHGEVYEKACGSVRDFRALRWRRVFSVCTGAVRDFTDCVHTVLR